MAICKNGIARIRVRASNGKDSKLFSDILDLFDGDRDMSIRAYAYINSNHFKELQTSNKLDDNNEPLLSDIINDLSDHFGTLDSPKRITKDTGKKGSSNYNFKSHTGEKINKNDVKRARAIISHKKSLLSETYKQLSVARLEKDYQELYNLTKRISQIQTDIRKVESELDAVAIKEIAVRDLRTAANVLKKNNFLSHDLIYAKSIVNNWIDAVRTYFPESTASNYIIYGEGESSVGVNGFTGLGEIENEASRLRNILEAKERQYMNNILGEETGRKIDINDVFFEQKDYTGVHAHTMSINRTNNVMFQSVNNINFRLMSKAKQEFADFELHFDEILKEALPAMKGMNITSNPYDIFREKYADGKETGNLVRQFKPEYDDVSAVKFKNAIDEDTFESWSNYYKWFDDNNLLLDWRIIFNDEVDESGVPLYKGDKTYTQKDKDNLKAEIVALVGEEEYNRMYRIAEKNLEEFRMTRELTYDDIQNNPKTTEEEKIKIFDTWEKRYSPYYYADVVSNNKPYTTEEDVIPAKGHAYTTVIPRRYKKGTSIETGWYNEKFNDIRSNKVVYKFYNTMLDTLYELNNMLPYNISKTLSDNSIPNLRKSVIDAWFSEGSKGAKKEIMNRIIKSMTAENSSDLAFAEVDPYTKEIKKNLTINIVKQNNNKINKIYSQKVIDYETKNGEASTEKKRELKKEAVDEVVKDKSFDLGQVIKVYYLTTKMYAKKAQIEDLVRIGDSVFKSKSEVQRTSDGRVKRTSDGKIARKNKDESFTNIKKQWDYWMDYFYGYRSEVEGLSSKKILNEDEKAEKEKIGQLLFDLHAKFEKGEMSMEEYDAKEEKLQIQLIELGGNISAGKIGRAMLKFVQLKAMGWNTMSGITNMAFGWIANVTEANYGLVYNKKDLAWATKKVFNSILKNYTFNMIETEDAKKIRSLVTRLDVLSETSNEIYQRTYKSSAKKPFAFLRPFNIQNRTEYFNQAPIMLAIMHNTFFETTKGKVMAYECFKEDGQWNTEEFGAEPETEVGKLQTKIAEEIARVHGNYNSEMPILANKKVWTTALKQFRTWMFEGAADRFQKHIYSEALGIDIYGRYRINHGGFAIFNWARPKDKPEDYTLGFMDVVENTGFTIIQLLRKLTFQNTKFEDKFTESDSANLRKNLSEFVILMQVSGFILLLSMLGGDDDDDIAATYMKNYMLNVLSRVQNDITYYISPNSFEQLTKQSIPAMSLITDGTKLMQATIDTAMGKGRITRGVYAGEHKLVRAMNRNLPLLNKIQANIGAMKQVYNDITFVK